MRVFIKRTLIAKFSMQDFMKKIIQYVVILFVMSTGTGYASARSDDYLNLLYKAKENSQNTSFKAIAAAYDNPQISWTFYQKSLEDGNPPLLRRETRENGNVREIKIRNQTGWYLIWNNIASKDEYANFDWSPGAIISKILVDDAKISVSSASYNGVQCYKVIVQGSDNIESFIKKAGCSREWAEENREKLKEQFCQLYSFLIDRKTLFIYSTRVFNPKGNLVYQLDFKQITFNPTLPDHLFQIPKEMERGKTFKTEAEMEKAFVVKKYFWHTWGEAIENFFAYHLDSILRISGKIAFWLAIITAILALIPKFRAKRQFRSR